MKKCRQCKRRFEPRPALAVICSPECAIAYASTDRAAKAAKAAKAKEARQDRSRVKTLPELRAEAQRAFNAYIRERDRGFGCVSCNHPNDGSRQMHAGHYRPAGNHPALRYHEDNCHAQCSRCNDWLSGNLQPYRETLVRDRIGLDRVLWLDGPHEHPKHTREELRAITAIYRAKLKALKAGHENTG